MDVFWLGIGLVAALALLAAWSFDRRSRHRGHQVRDGADIFRDVREQHRDLRAGDAQEYLSQDQSWTHRSRQSKDRNAREVPAALVRGGGCRSDGVLRGRRIQQHR